MKKEFENIVSVWEKLENRWPVAGCSEHINFCTMKDKLEDILIEREVIPQAFGHFGFVVNNIKSSITALRTFNNCKNTDEIKIDWVEVFSLYVARTFFEGMELEFILPKGKNFFHTFLEKEGEHLHHLAFQVNNIDQSLEKLKSNGIKLINKKPESGAHGKVAFLIPSSIFCRIYIELYQVYE